MKFASRLVACLVAAGSVVALVPLTSTALQADIVSSNLLDHANVLQIIASWSGGKRSHGTIGYNYSVAYFKFMLDYTGFYDTELLPVTSKDVSFTALSISDSTPTSYTDFDPLFGSPAGLVTGTFRVISNGGCASTDYPSGTTGKLVVIRRGSCTFSRKLQLAKTAGAVGAIIVNNDPNSGHFFAGIVDPALNLVPGIFLHKTEGDSLIAKIALNPSLSGTINVQFTGSPVVGYTLIATTKSGDRDHVVQMGAHLDSSANGPGMNDNASSAVALLELARNLSKYTFTNAVRFCFWAAEEHGLVGSYQYIKSLSTLQLSKIALYLNFELLASPNAGYFVFDPDCAQAENPAVCPPPGVAHIRNTFQSYFTTYSGVTAQSHDMYGVSDHQNFLDVGIPSGYLTSGLGELITPAQATLWGTTAGVAFDPCYHQACDTVSNLNMGALVINAKGAAHALATYANSVSGLSSVSGKFMSPYQRRSLYSSKFPRSFGHQRLRS